ncbi:WD40-repeat containing protein [Chondrus crispus]|uniref:WD40-repeat containing protein n=1 Tax=Chondrus crispus TaxID=2769 RepID=R7QR87_CHOCR|nr:WD40-repeat containing protein [Chondrus crispus]CDF40982.1 WD40-repeat containing protein [Chondrus crispus]|eukprot:XP_005711276.1 WD40-repeat containing protein [Chondrus crispus]
MLRSSIRNLDSNGTREGLSFGEMHRGLCVMKKQDVIPLTVLRDFWETGDVRSAEKYAREMNSVGLVDIHHEVKSKNVEIGVRLHDLTHDFAIHEAEQMEGSSWEQKWHRKAVDSYRKERGVLEAVVEDQGAQASDAREQYFFENVCRLLLKGEMMTELRGLLVSARWIIKVLLRKAVWQLEAAVKEVTEVSCQGTGTTGTAGTAEDEALSTIALVMKAARLSAPFCDEHVAGICFQLYDRTMHKREWRDVEAFLSEIKRFAPRPWLLPLRPCLPRAGERLLETFKTLTPLTNVAFDSEGAVVGWAYGKEATATALQVFTFTQQETVVKSISNNVYGGRRSDEGETVMDEEPETEMSRLSQVLEEGREPAQRNLCQDEASTEAARPTVSVPEERLQRTERKNWVAKVGQEIRKKVRACNCLRRGFEVAYTSENVVQDSESRVRSTSRLSGASSVSATGPHDSVSGASGTESVGGIPGSESETGRVAREVTAAFVSRNSSRAILGHDNGDVVALCMKRKEVIQCFKGHLDKITAVTMSEDGKRVASGSRDNTARVWGFETGRQIGEALEGHSDWVKSVAMSWDGKRVVLAVDSTVQVWDGDTWRQAWEAKIEHAGWISSVAMSWDGKQVVSGSLGGTVQVWNGDTGRQVWEATPYVEDYDVSVAMSGDGKRVVSGFDCTVRVWDGDTGRQIGETITEHLDRVISVAMNGDGKRVVSGSLDNTVRVWDGDTGRQIGETMTGHTSQVTSLAMNGDGKRVVSGSLDNMRVWDGDTGRQVGETMAHRTWVNSVAMSGDGKRVASGSEDSTVCVWDSDTGRQIGGTRTEHSASVNSVAMSGDGKRVVSGSRYNTARLFDVETGGQIGATMTGHKGRVICVAMSKDGKRVVSGSRDKTARMWDDTGRQVWETNTEHTGWVMSVAMSWDGKRVVSGSSDHTVRVWDGDTGRQIGEAMEAQAPVTSVAMSGDGKRIWSWSQGFDSLGPSGTVRGWKQRSSRLDMPVAGSGVWVPETCGICEVSDKIIHKQGDGSEIILAHLECWATDFMVNMECETIVVGMENGSVGIMSVISSDDDASQ